MATASAKLTGVNDGGIGSTIKSWRKVEGGSGEQRQQQKEARQGGSGRKG